MTNFTKAGWLTLAAAFIISAPVNAQDASPSAGSSPATTATTSPSPSPAVSPAALSPAATPDFASPLGEPANQLGSNIENTAGAVDLKPADTLGTLDRSLDDALINRSNPVSGTLGAPVLQEAHSGSATGSTTSTPSTTGTTGPLLPTSSPSATAP